MTVKVACGDLESAQLLHLMLRGRGVESSMMKQAEFKASGGKSRNTMSNDAYVVAATIALADMPNVQRAFKITPKPDSLLVAAEPADARAISG